MDLRISAKAKRDLDALAGYSSKTLIFKKALRKWRRLWGEAKSVEFFKRYESSTRNPFSIKVPFGEGLSPSALRSILSWYLEDQSPRPNTPLELDPSKQKYIIKECPL